MESGSQSSENDLSKQISSSDMLTSINSIQFSKYNVTRSGSGGNKQKSDLTALRRNSDTILINSIGINNNSSLNPKQVNRLKSTNTYRLQSSNLLSSHVKEEDQHQLQQQQQHQTTTTSKSSNLNIADNLNESSRNLSQNSLFSNDNYLSAPSPITPQSPVQSPSSPTQSQNSLILNKYSLSNTNLNSNNSNSSNLNSTTPSPATSKVNLISSSTKSVVLTHLQNLNNKFLRKRHSVSILKYNSNSNSSNNNTNHNTSPAATAAAAAAAAAALSTSNSANLNAVNSQSLLSQFNKMITNNSSYHNQKNTLMLPLTNNSSLLVDSYGNSLPSTTSHSHSGGGGSVALKGDKKANRKSGSSSHNSSIKSKRKQKRSKSAPINQRSPFKLANQSTLHALLSPSYMKKAVATSSSKNVKFNQCMFCALKKQNNSSMLNFYSGLFNNMSSPNNSGPNSASQTR
jgi:hypothetical protein